MSGLNVGGVHRWKWEKRKRGRRTKENRGYPASIETPQTPKRKSSKNRGKKQNKMADFTSPPERIQEQNIPPLADAASAFNRAVHLPQHPPLGPPPFPRMLAPYMRHQLFATRKYLQCAHRLRLGAEDTREARRFPLPHLDVTSEQEQPPEPHAPVSRHVYFVVKGVFAGGGVFCERPAESALGASPVALCDCAKG